MKLPDLDSAGLAQLLSGVSDLTLMLDASGVVEDVSTARDTLQALGCQAWIGRPWVDTVTPESRAKVDELLATVSRDRPTPPRHINHAVANGPDVALQYTLLVLGVKGQRLAVARDLGGVADLQRRLVETQQAMERDYQRSRHIEARYRVLFDNFGDAVVLVDAGTQRVVEGNAQAQALLRDGARSLVGRDILECFAAGSQSEVQALLRMALATGRIEMSSAQPIAASAGPAWTVSAMVFRQEGGPQFLMRLVARDGGSGRADTGALTALSEAMTRYPDGWVLADAQGLIRNLNDEAMVMLGLASPSQAVGQPLESWLRRGSVDWGVLSTNLRQQLPVRHFATELRTQSGVSLPVEISAVSLSRPEPMFAFFLRDIGRRPAVSSSAASDGLEGALGDMAQMVGRRPIKDIVGEAVDTIERQCIESALQITHDNRAAAAEMLGLSRQSLYVKLRRFGLMSDSDAE